MTSFKKLNFRFIFGILSLFLCSAYIFTSGCTFNVKPRVTIAEQELLLGIGDKYTLVATSPDSESIVWSSSDDGVVTVSDEGVVVAVAAGEAVITASSISSSANCLVTVSAILNKGERRLIWHDEFEENYLDPSKWGYQLGVRDTYGSSQGPIYWGNNELQYYTEDAAAVSDGMLVITASKDGMPEGREFSSARIHTRDKFSFTYGYIEARISMPAIDGMWPAFWMLPQPSSMENSNNEYGGWAASGEIDIMEAKGRLRNVTGHTLHYGNRGASTYSSGNSTLDGTINDWHTYGLEWTENYIAWFVDDEEVYRIISNKWWTSAVSKDENPVAPFDKDFYILLNLAVGGNYDGGTRPPENFTSATMKVDYVRVYQ